MLTLTTLREAVNVGLRLSGGAAEHRRLTRTSPTPETEKVTHHHTNQRRGRTS